MSRGYTPRHAQTAGDLRIFFNFSTTSNHLHPLQVENCDSNSRLVVDEDDNGKFRLERVNVSHLSQLINFNIPDMPIFNSLFIRHLW